MQQCQCTGELPALRSRVLASVFGVRVDFLGAFGSTPIPPRELSEQLRGYAEYGGRAVGCLRAREVVFCARGSDS